MFSSFIENLFGRVAAGAVTEVFLYIITAIFIFALVFKAKNRYGSFTNYAASLMTSVGILGTFVGIVIGLAGFDTTDVAGSIPDLLEGLKVAFITSVYGLVGAVGFNLLTAFIKFSPQNDGQGHEQDTIGPNEIYQSLEAQRQVLQRIAQGLSGSEEGSLLGQLKLLRVDTAAEQRQQTQLLTQLEHGFAHFSATHAQEKAVFEQKLFDSLEQFAQMLSRSATEQIIAALKTVIEDFNKNLTEQFGENFKALDASVARLVVWQQQYKDQLETLGAQYEQSVVSLGQTRDAVQVIGQECAQIPETMQSLQAVLTVNQHQIAELARHLEVFVSAREAAIQAVPTIQSSVELVSQQLSVSGKALEQTATGLTRELTDLMRHFDGYKDSTLTGFQQISKSLQTELQTTFSQAQAEMDAHMKNAAQKTGESVNTQLQQMETATAREIQKAMQELGNALVQITGRFVEDYQAMVQAMDRVVAQHR